MSDDAQIYQEALKFHRDRVGKLSMKAIKPITNAHDLSLTYTPGVAEACRVIAKDKSESFNLTMRGRAVAIISDGTRVLGLGNIGPKAALPVMEGKAFIFKKFANIDAIPICVKEMTKEEFLNILEQNKTGEKI